MSWKYIRLCHVLWLHFVYIIKFSYSLTLIESLNLIKVFPLLKLKLTLNKTKNVYDFPFLGMKFL